MPPQRRRWKGLRAATRTLLELTPDEHDCLDFKQNAHPLTDEYLATMANAAALAGKHHATVLVGVAEQRDPRTGVTSGRIVGFADDLHKTGETIAGRASNTGPTPVQVEIFEENVDSKPILRVEIRPTAPPHYDQKGRRATRQHSTTRAMSDEEILSLLLAREQHRYAAVAEETANLMMGDFRVVTNEVLDAVERQQFDSDDSAQRLLGRVEESTQEIVERFDELWARIDHLEEQLGDRPREVDPSDPQSMEHTLRRVLRARQMGLLIVSRRLDELTDAEIEAIERVLNSPLDPLTYVQNERELLAWDALHSIGFEDGADMATAIQAVVAAHDSNDSVQPVSLREHAARHRRERELAGSIGVRPADASRYAKADRSTALPRTTIRHPASSASVDPQRGIDWL